MKIEYTKETPRKIRDYNQEEIVLNSEEVEDIAEIFKTPLTGTYNWDYSVPVSYTHLTLPTKA